MGDDNIMYLGVTGRVTNTLITRSETGSTTSLYTFASELYHYSAKAEK